MKPTVNRRFRRRSAPAKTEGVFFKKESQETFFGGGQPDVFFQPLTTVAPAPAVQRKCDGCEEEDKKVQRLEDKKEEEKIMKMDDGKEEEKLQRQPDQKEEEKVQRQPEKKEEEKVMKQEDKKEEDKVQKKENNTPASGGKSLGNYVSSLNGKGQPLPAQANHFFSSKMGYDFSEVKVHTDKEAAESAKGINAKAYTIGNNVVFNEGQYNTESGEGKRLMAHELAHVLQKDDQKLQRQAPLARPATRVTPQSKPNLRVLPGEYGQYQTVTPNYGPSSNPYTQGPLYMPERFDDSKENLAALKNRENARAWKKNQLEMPELTTTQGGEAPDFATFESSGRRYEDQYLGVIDYVPRKFHLLSKIDYDFANANDEQSLSRVLIYYKEWFINSKFCKVGEPNFDPSIYRKYFMYQVPQDLDVYRIRQYIVEVFQQRLKKIRELQAKIDIAKALAEAEEFALEGKERKHGPCAIRSVPRKGGYSPHDIFAAHVALSKGSFLTAAAETEFTTPEGISYSFDAFNIQKNHGYEVKTGHDWTGDLYVGNTMYWDNFMKRAMGLEAQRLKGLYVANRCGIGFSYVFDNCTAMLGMRKQWSNVPPVEYIPYPGDPKENCS